MLGNFFEVRQMNDQSLKIQEQIKKIERYGILFISSE